MALPRPVQGGPNNAKTVYDNLISAGLPAPAAAGVVGNFIQESNVDPNSAQKGGPGHGIAQWSAGGRWDQLTAWAKTQGRDPYALSTQTAFAINELKSMGIWQKLAGTNDPTVAARIVETEYEKPNPQYANSAGRAANARKVLENNGVGTGAVRTPENAVDFSALNPLNAVDFSALNPLTAAERVSATVMAFVSDKLKVVGVALAVVVLLALGVFLLISSTKTGQAIGETTKKVVGTGVKVGAKVAAL